jgi:hypothetical protein
MKTTAELRRLAHPADARGTRARIAVLPFDDLTPDGPAASVADTLMALVISNLAARDGIPWCPGARPCATGTPARRSPTSPATSMRAASWQVADELAAAAND